MATTEEAAPFVQAFRLAQGIQGESALVTARRDAAMQNFAALGFPGRKQEAWRFTDLRPLTATPILPDSAPGIDLDETFIAPARLSVSSFRIVLVKGCVAPKLSCMTGLPDGVWMGSTAEAAQTRPDLLETAFDASDNAGAQPLASLNAAFFADGFIVAIGAGIVLETPIEIIHVTRSDSAVSWHTRNAIILGAGSQATVVESAIGSGPGWTNIVTSVDIGEGGKLRHAKVQNESIEAIHTALIRATVARSGRYEIFNLTLGARLSRQDMHIALAGESASFALNGAYLLRGTQEATIAPFVDHQAFGCKTNEVVKGVMDDRAHGVFLGMMAVRPGADQTNAHQLNRNLLLSREARVDTKPELEIFADDVKCSHGATVGSLDEAALFYLRSRGLDEETARHMLVEAFAAEVIDTADLGDAISSYLRRQLQAWLDGPKNGI
ncbi:MAG: Fe-S cluster assembly protein SufD [Beijerinckiaceae bacterium]|jgi:Fe-S cluster assembly protein SufD